MSESMFILENGQQVGPLGLEQIRAMANSGRVTPATMYWREGLSGWVQLDQAHPELFATQPAAESPRTDPWPASTPPAPVASSGGTRFEVLRQEFYQMPKITITDSEVVIEAGALHYMIGTIQIESQMPSVGQVFKAKLTGERVFRPRYRGTGEIFLEPTFGECNIMELQGEEWILDRGCFLAADPGVEIGMFTNKAFSGFFGGEGFFQTSVKGHGKVLYHAQGPIERIELDGSRTLTVDGSFAVARTASLEYRVEKATKRMFSSLTSGEGLVNTFRGRGTVLLAAVPNRFLTMLRQFGGLQHAISRISKG